jgi:hypothetical protein
LIQEGKVKYFGLSEGGVISQKNLATFIAKMIASPENYLRKNPGINKPNS